MNTLFDNISRMRITHAAGLPADSAFLAGHGCWQSTLVAKRVARARGCNG